MKSVIVIPVYKPIPDWNEVISFNQCLHVFKKHSISIITFKNLDISYYTVLLKNSGINHNIELFDKDYFKSEVTYSQLLLTKAFYLRFKYFEYMLIYQLDAYVFRDELEYWCNKEYDYIGAPWFEDCSSHEEGAKLWKVGNGGFSLRKTSRFIQILSYKGPVFKPGFIRSKISFRKSTNKIVSLILLIAKSLGYKNTISYIVDNNSDSEDFFWSFTFKESWLKFKIAPTEIAYRFSFEISPSYLFELNNRILPFGCHAWQKFDYENFWVKHIPAID